MRIKITAESTKNVEIPINYQYVIHSAIYDLFRKASPEYSDFLHNIGFKDGKKHLKLFTFSKLFFERFRLDKKRSTFKGIKKFDLYFSSPIKKSFEKFVYGIFQGNVLNLKFNNREYRFEISYVETLEEISFAEEMIFKCLSPISVSTLKQENFEGKVHFLDYMKVEEKKMFMENIKKNLIRKYRLVHKKDFEGDENLEIIFDPTYIAKKQGKISKMIHFKNNIKIIGMEAPFTLKADPELIKIGYSCGFGEKNSAGFGMVEKI